MIAREWKSEVGIIAILYGFVLYHCTNLHVDTVLYSTLSYSTMPSPPLE
jgi:hypothetical protein